MNQHRLTYLLQQYQANECTAPEMEELNDWFHAYNPGENDLDRWIDESGGPEAMSACLYKDFNSRMHKASIQSRTKRIFRTTAAAAAVVAALIFSLYRGKSPAVHRCVRNSATRNNLPAHQIKVGSNQALLTLADGTSIPLNDSDRAAVAVQNNTRIRQVHGGKISYDRIAGPSLKEQLVYNTLTTPRGGKFSVTLADGTLATLDASSSIVYPVAFGSDERRVEVTGQVFFEVVHNVRKPFRVITKGQTIEDIGTSFNIKAYGDEPWVKVTVAGGKVKVFNASATATLTPGQQARVEDDGRDIRVQYVDVAETIAWKNGWFALHHEHLESIMKQAARWYDVDVIYERTPVNKEFGGMISRYKDISELLQNLRTAGGMNYRIEGRKVIFF